MEYRLNIFDGLLGLRHDTAANQISVSGIYRYLTGGVNHAAGDYRL
jgi:hypothetical protein